MINPLNSFCGTADEGRSYVSSGSLISKQRVRTRRVDVRRQRMGSEGVAGVQAFSTAYLAEGRGYANAS